MNGRIIADFLSNSLWQLTQAQTGKFNVHVHVEYEWCLHNEDLDESDDEMEDKVHNAIMLFTFIHTVPLSNMYFDNHLLDIIELFNCVYTVCISCV